MMSLPSVDIRIEHAKYGAIAVITFSETVDVLSSCILNGGFCETKNIIIQQVPPDYMCDDPLKDAKDTLEILGLPNNTVVFMTAAEVEYVLSETEIEHDGYSTMSIATAGLSNQVIAGDELTDWGSKHALSQKRREALLSHTGTINTIGITADPLSDSAKVNSFIAMTEAKSAALQDLGYRETGTTSDAIAIVCPKNGTLQHYAGTGFGYGLSLAKAVRSSVRKSLIKRGDFPLDISQERIDELKRLYL